MNLFITGATGFLGWNLARWFSTRGDFVVGSTHRSSPFDASCAEWHQLDLESPQAGVASIPGNCNAIIHCAAMASAKACDENREKAFSVNVEGTDALSLEALERRIPFIFISTDLVFDGSKAPYFEMDPPSPASWYGETKAIAEERVRSIVPHHYILRTALMFGLHGNHPGSFLRWTVDGFRERRQLELYTNQFRNPLYAVDVARCVHRLLDSDQPFGTYHIGGPQRYSRYEIGKHVATVYGFDASSIIPTRLQRDERFGSIDDTTLNTDKVVAATGVAFTSLDDGLASVHNART